MNIFKSRFFQFALLLAVLVGIAGTILYVSQKEEEASVSTQTAVTKGRIVDFNYDRDHAYISSVFDNDENWYWLVEGTREDFSPEEMMQNMSSSRHPGAPRNLIIKMLYVDDKPVGFLAYYMKNFYMGKIRFVFVDPSERGAGYGGQLVNYAVHDLKAHGATKISLITRSTNVAAQKIYKKAGFELEPSPEGFANFSKVL